MAEMPHLVQVQQSYRDQGFSIVAVTDVERDVAKRFALDNGLNFPILSEAEPVREAYGVDLIWGSAFFLVDPTGTIVEQGLDDCLARVEAELGAAASEDDAS